MPLRRLIGGFVVTHIVYLKKAGQLIATGTIIRRTTASREQLKSLTADSQTRNLHRVTL